MKCPIYTDVVAIHYLGQQENIPLLNLDEKVRLIREPDNEYDSNAILVETVGGDPLGYINKILAAKISALLDNLSDPLPANITALEGGRFTEHTNIRLYFEIPDTSPDFLDDRLLEFCFDERGDFGYIHVNADEYTFGMIREKFQSRGFEVLLSGKSIRRAENGKQYRWFLKVFDSAKVDQPESGKPTREDIESIFEKEFGVRSDQAIIEDLRGELDGASRRLEIASHEVKKAENNLTGIQERLEEKRQELQETRKGEDLFQKEIDRLEQDLIVTEQEIVTLREQRYEAEDQVHVLSREMKQTGGDPTPGGSRDDLGLEEILAYLLPEVSFLRDSFAELFSFQNPVPMLELIGQAIANPQAVRSKRLEGTGNKKWREYEKHISTGSDNTGRLYYSREGDQLRFLISNKRRQKGDVNYLKNQ